MTKYTGENYTMKATLSDGTSLITPSEQKIRLIDPSGIEHDVTTTPSLISAGIYKATLSIPLDGKPGVWTVCWRITYEGNIDNEQHKFRVYPHRIT